MPLQADMVQSMASVAVLRNQPQLGLALFVGFAGLLRVGAILNLELHLITVAKAKLCILNLPASKGAKHKGQLETVLIKDPSLVKALRKRIASEDPYDPLRPPPLWLGARGVHLR